MFELLDILLRKYTLIQKMVAGYPRACFWVSGGFYELFQSFLLPLVLSVVCKHSHV